ncbi:3533_t:CDS:2 [Paraglomus occultum]|uniref:3533_t:CDS:1 n=1 Tax=Paraglomus occultum TaxID=144539 RepID=A0A9N8ZZX3_9GLOM|nr:3533_t:CDS:2 [Paraglomus occultum]
MVSEYRITTSRSLVHSNGMGQVNNTADNNKICNCGVAASLRRVTADTYNKGRLFWGCHKIGTDFDNRCKFFEWANKESSIEESPISPLKAPKSQGRKRAAQDEDEAEAKGSNRGGEEACVVAETLSPLPKSRRITAPTELVDLTTPLVDLTTPPRTPQITSSPDQRTTLSVTYHSETSFNSPIAPTSSIPTDLLAQLQEALRQRELLAVRYRKERDEAREKLQEFKLRSEQSMREAELVQRENGILRRELDVRQRENSLLERRLSVVRANKGSNQRPRI